MNCICCGEEIELNNQINTCKVCSTSYNKKGELCLQRHNWNMKEYKKLFSDKKLNIKKSCA